MTVRRIVCRLLHRRFWKADYQIIGRDITRVDNHIVKFTIETASGAWECSRCGQRWD